MLDAIPGNPACKHRWYSFGYHEGITFTATRLGKHVAVTLLGEKSLDRLLRRFSSSRWVAQPCKRSDMASGTARIRVAPAPFHRRFVGIERAQLLSMIDLDAALYVEYDDSSKEPLALIETARDVGPGLQGCDRHAESCEARGLALLLRAVPLWRSPNPADPAWRDVESFRVKRLWPRPEREWRTLTPHEWAHALPCNQNV